ncbi:MAG: hypothetical protein ACP5OA_04055 [Candidatus Woesearchaeota archaeon]
MGDKRNTLLLVGMLLMFAAIFFIAFAGLKTKETLFDIGIPVMFENWLIMFLSLGSIARIVWELYKE